MTPADWIAATIGGSTNDVDGVVPEGFESYVRLFHPVSLRVDGSREPVRWSDIATANAKVADSEIQWGHISGVRTHSGEGTPGLWNVEPDTGTLPIAYASRLSELLKGYTTTPEHVWFCVWEGYGGCGYVPTIRVSVFL